MGNLWPGDSCGALYRGWCTTDSMHLQPCVAALLQAPGRHAGWRRRPVVGGGYGALQCRLPQARQPGRADQSSCCHDQGSPGHAQGSSSAQLWGDTARSMVSAICWAAMCVVLAALIDLLEAQAAQAGNLRPAWSVCSCLLLSLTDFRASWPCLLASPQACAAQLLPLSPRRRFFARGASLRRQNV